MSDTFCVMPWLGKEIYQNGRVGHCCWLSPQYDIDLIRSELNAGIKTSDPWYFSPDTPVNERTIQELDKQDSLKGINRRDFGILY